ncbi:MAG: PLD nuclease N-terminal domain-containing protein [Actinomycetes bacterium]
MVRFLFYAMPVILGVWAIVDCAQTAPADVRKLPRPLWVFIIAFVPVVGPVLWLAVGRSRGAHAWQRPIPRPSAPDDDPDFLRDLDRKRRRDESDS